MSIRFAAAGNGECASVARHLGIAPLPAPANDQDPALGRDRLLRQTLRHFATYGIQAAERARDNAEVAFFEGRRGDYHHWMAICRTLDRRMATQAIAARARI